MTTQTQTTEERLSKLEGAYGQVNERFNDLAQAVREGDANLRQVEANLREEIRAGDAALRADMNERFNELARGQDALREEIRQGDAALREETNARFSEMNARFSEMNTRFNIMLVLIGGVWATTVGGFIALFTRL